MTLIQTYLKLEAFFAFFHEKPELNEDLFELPSGEYVWYHVVCTVCYNVKNKNIMYRQKKKSAV